MNRFARPFWVAVLLVSTEFSGVAEGQGMQYKGIAIPPYEFYEALLGYVDSEDDEGLRRAMSYLRPLAEFLHKETGEHPGHQIEAAIENGPRKQVELAVLRLIYLDLKYHLTCLQESGNGHSIDRERVQAAYVVYSFLSPAMARREAGADKEIRKLFKELYRSRQAGSAAALFGTVSKRVESALFNRGTDK